MNIISKIFNTKKTLLEMLDLRKFETDKHTNFNLEEIDIMYRSMDKKVSHENSPLDFNCINEDKTCYIKFVLFTKLRLANLKTLINNMIDEYVKEGDTIIFIVKDKINNIDLFDSSLNVYLENNNIFIQIFWMDTLLFNITKHELVPPMRILNIEEKNSLLKKANINTFIQLPLILKNDPVAKFYGLKKGNVVEITRPSPTAGIYKNYRYCQ